MSFVDAIVALRRSRAAVDRAADRNIEASHALAVTRARLAAQPDVAALLAEAAALARDAA